MEIPSLSDGSVAAFAAEQPSEPPAELMAIGAPPQKAAALQLWGYQMLNALAWDLARDPKISAETRRRRLPAMLAAAAKLYPDAARFENAESARAAAEVLEGKKRARAAAKLERRPAAGGAKVIPIRRE